MTGARTFAIAAIAFVCGTAAAALLVTYESPCECRDYKGPVVPGGVDGTKVLLGESAVAERPSPSVARQTARAHGERTIDFLKYRVVIFFVSFFWLRLDCLIFRRGLPDARTPRFGYSTVMLNVVSMVKLNSSNVPPTWIVWLPGLSGASIR